MPVLKQELPMVEPKHVKEEDLLRIAEAVADEAYSEGASGQAAIAYAIIALVEELRKHSDGDGCLNINSMNWDGRRELGIEHATTRYF